ncbi:hypothetical protein AB0D10_05525 [Kitasatospora sp. NPDC048545]|uniref:hypothetical protein n=1 Tax=Kitasatospora sp. NPDC048545 TaxID=3157208 RepID=UPI0033DE4AEE
MTPAQILAFGIVHVCTPGPTGGWDHDIQSDLDLRDEWHHATLAAEFGSDEWCWARHKRHSAETRIATALGIYDYRRAWVIPA